jgi:phosphate transport system permease protein
MSHNCLGGILEALHPTGFLHMGQSFTHLPMGWLGLAVIVILASLGFFAGRVKAEKLVPAQGERQHSRPNHHGFFVAMWAAMPAVLVAAASLFGSEVLARQLLRSELPPTFASFAPHELKNYIDLAAYGAMNGLPDEADKVFRAVAQRYADLRGQLNLGTLVAMSLFGLMGLWFASRAIAPQFRARTHVESGLQAILFLCAGIAIATTVAIIASLLFESLLFFSRIPLTDFIFGTQWNASAPKPGPKDFGFLPIFYGTVMIALIAMAVAAPVGLFAAIYLSEYARPSVRATVKPLLEVLAGIPTVVYGFFAASTIAPLVRQGALGLNSLLMNTGITAEPLLAAQPLSALAAGLVMGIMIIPFVSSLSDDVINAVPQTMRDGAYAMGATKSETVRQVVLPAALPGIVASLLLAVSRAIGETMIVVMAAGKFARISPDPTMDLTTITVQIVSLLTGESGFDDAKTLSAFALGLVLFIITLIFNLIALAVVRRFREKYE